MSTKTVEEVIAELTEITELKQVGPPTKAS